MQEIYIFAQYAKPTTTTCPTKCRLRQLAIMLRLTRWRAHTSSNYRSRRKADQIPCRVSANHEEKGCEVTPEIGSWHPRLSSPCKLDHYFFASKRKIRDRAQSGYLISRLFLIHPLSSAFSHPEARRALCKRLLSPQRFRWRRRGLCLSWKVRYRTFPWFFSQMINL